MWEGSEFQRVGGAATEKDPITPSPAFSPGDLQQFGRDGPEGSGGGVVMEEVGEVGGGGGGGLGC